MRLVFAFILLFIALPSLAREIELEGAIMLSIELDTANMTVEGRDQERLDIQDGDLEYRILREKGRIIIRSSYKRAGKIPEVKIRMPRDMALELKLDEGRVIVREIESEIKITLDQGEILLDGTSGAYNVAVNVGNIASKIFLDGEAKFKTVQGNILISVLSDDSMPMEIESSKGDIMVELPQGYHATLDMFSGKGDVNCDFSLSERLEESGRIKGKIGGGGPYLKINAYDGAVWIRKILLPYTKPKKYVPSYSCSLTQITPRIDGYPNDRTWWHGDLIELDGASALFRHDGYKLYGLIVVRCDSERLKAKVVERDEKFRDDDRIELIFATDQHKYTILINPLETIYDKAADESWSPIIEVASGLEDKCWLIELAIPLKAISCTPLSRLKFNLKIKADNVNTEWVKDGLGEMRLLQKNLKTWTSKLKRVNVKGAEPLERDDVLRLANLNEGDEIPLDRLEIIRDHLLLTGIFRDLSFVVEKRNNEVEMTLRPLPNEVYSIEEVEVLGETLFDQERVKRLFRTIEGIIPKERVMLLAKLIEKLYRERGYELAKVNVDLKDQKLIVKVNEGIISRLEVEGARTSREDVKRAFGKLPFLVKSRTDLERKIRDVERILKGRNSSFKAVKTWQLENITGGYLLRLQIVEERKVSFHISPLFDFNRVHGVMLGGGCQIGSKLYRGGRVYFELSRGFSSKVWDYNFGAEKEVLPKKWLAIGGHIYRMTDTNDRWRISSVENLLAELLFGKAYMDFFRRDGWEVYSFIRFFEWFRLRMGYRDEKQENLNKVTDWYLFYNGGKGEPRYRVHRTRGGWKVPQMNDLKRENLPIDEGEIRSLWVRCYLDLRDKRRYQQHHFIEEPLPSQDIQNGWIGYIGTEIAGKRFGGDFDFSFVEFMITRYSSFRRHRFDLRVMGAYTPDKGGLPKQRRIYLGGLGSLRGYHSKEFWDDSFLMVNADYGLKLLVGIQLNLFLDMGYLWYKGEIHISSGFGFSVGPLRLDLAQALEDSDREMIASLRLGRIF